MRIGVFVTARMGSSRLADKHLRPIGDRAALSYLLDRIDAEFAPEIAAGTVLPVLTTGNEARNRPLADLCIGRHTQMYYGDDDNVPRRHLQAAQALTLDAMVSVDGDDLFCAPEAMRCVHDMLAHGAGLAKTNGLPIGMNSWGYSLAVLDMALRNIDLSLLETGWGRIFDGVPTQEVTFDCPRADEVRATLDYEPDLAFFSRGILEVPGWEALPTVEFVQRIMARGIQRENAGLNEQYWENFSRNITRENAKDSE